MYLMLSLQLPPHKQMHARHINWVEACLARSDNLFSQARLSSRCRARTHSAGDLFGRQLTVTRVPRSQAASLSSVMTNFPGALEHQRTCPRPGWRDLTPPEKAPGRA